jgi:hypothetical protein
MEHNGIVLIDGGTPFEVPWLWKLMQTTMSRTVEGIGLYSMAMKFEGCTSMEIPDD